VIFTDPMEDLFLKDALQLTPGGMLGGGRLGEGFVVVDGRRRRIVLEDSSAYD
jgi:hypothetical protein